MSPGKVLIVGNPSEGHVGSHLLAAAGEMNQPVEFMNVLRAYEGSLLRRKWNWWVRGHRPADLANFERELVALCQRTKPAALLVVGITPPGAATLRAIKAEGVACGNYLTDDPWNRHHHAPWFLDALPEYHHVFSPRRANLDELREHCRPATGVSYLPFAYNPKSHFPTLTPPGEAADLASDVLFAGGADQDRLPWIHDLIHEGWKVALYGGYWKSDRVTRPHARGIAGMEQLRRAVACAKVCLCLVRRANRDGHAMRTFELPAMGACLLVERTLEHEALFGSDGEAVMYFDSRQELRSRVTLLLGDPKLRQSLAERCAQLIAHGAQTYADRLRTMVDVLAEGA